MAITRSRRKGSRPSGVDESASAISKRRSKRSKRSKGNQLGRAGGSLKAALRKQKEALLALENAEWALIVAQRTRDKAERALWSADEKVNTLRMAELPRDIWQKIVDEYLHQNDMFAFAMTCKFFRDTTKDFGKKMETNLNYSRLLELRKSGKMASHSLDWFRWVWNTRTILPRWGEPGFAWRYRAVSEGDLLNYAAFQGSAEVLRWLMEEEDWELNEDTGRWAGMGGSVEILEYLKGEEYEFREDACRGAARGGHLKALKWFRQQLLLKPYVYLDRDEYGPYIRITWEGPLVAKCLKIAERNNHEDTASWLRSELTHLSNIPQLPESDSDWSGSLW